MITPAFVISCAVSSSGASVWSYQPLIRKVLFQSTPDVLSRRLANS